MVIARVPASVRRSMALVEGVEVAEQPLREAALFRGAYITTRVSEPRTCVSLGLIPADRRLRDSND